MSMPPHATMFERIWRRLYLAFCAGVFLFLIAPIIVIVPLSFNAEPYFTFTRDMLALDPDGFSLRWYDRLLTYGMTAPDAIRDGAWWADAWANSQWIHAAKNSFAIGISSTLIATALGTLAALGLSRPEMPFRRAMIISATGLFFFYSKAGLAHTYIGIVLAHAMLGIPFVIITVTATLSGFDRSLIHAAASLGASPVTTFRKVILPLILPGVISGALFAFVTSFDEVVVVLFVASYDQQTIPLQMWNGIREQISPTILAAATILILFSIALLTTLELLRRRTERLRGLSG